MNKEDLTYKSKKLSYDDKRAIEQLKYDMTVEQGCRCYVCRESFGMDVLSQMAHRISKAERHIKKYGYEVIHHRFNIRITCADCNSSVMINSSKTLLVDKLIKRIHEDLGIK